ncbi:MAG: hypothetical protein ACTSYV_03700 [Candidatus Heimdallarchaeaceae archaeon]
MTPGNVFLGYNHNTGEFKELKDTSKYQTIMDTDAKEMSGKLETLDLDGILIFNRDKGEWHLIFGSHLGLVAQRTARRQADTISRSGYLLSNGERVGVNCRLEQLTEDNIGDLYKTVQEKYIETDLAGFQGDSRSDSFPSTVYARTEKVEKPEEKQPTTQIEDKQLLPPPREYPPPGPAVESTSAPTIKSEEEKVSPIEPSTLITETEPTSESTSEEVVTEYIKPAPAIESESLPEEPAQKIEQVVEEITEDVVDTVAESVKEKVTEEIVQTVEDETVRDQVQEKVDSLIEKAKEEVVEEVVESATEEIVDEVKEEIAEATEKGKTMEEIVEGAVEEAKEEIKEEVLETTQETFESTVEDVVEEVIQEILEDTTEDVAAEIAKEIAEETVEEAVEEITEKVDELVEESKEQISEAMEETTEEVVKETIEEEKND